MHCIFLSCDVRIDSILVRIQCELVVKDRTQLYVSYKADI